MDDELTRSGAPARALPARPAGETVNRDSEEAYRYIQQDRVRVGATQAGAALLDHKPRGVKEWVAYLLADLRLALRTVGSRRGEQDRVLPGGGVRNEGLDVFTTADGRWSPKAVDRYGRQLVMAGNFPAAVDTDAGVHGASTVRVVESAPDAADILNGSRATTGVVITIPAGRTWRGNVTLTAALRVAAGGGNVDANATVTFNPGTGGTASWAPAAVEMSVAATGGLGGVGDCSNQAAVAPDIICYAGTTTATFTLAQTNCTQFFASCSGRLVA